MSDDQSLSLIKQEEEKKRAAWGGFGVALHRAGITLQLMQQEIEKLLVVPTETDQLPAAEETLKIAKQKKVELESYRLKNTSKFDEVKERLMRPEKAVDAKLIEFGNEIIKLKRLKADQDAKKQKVLDELNSVAHKVRLYVADINESYLQAHAKLISESYKHALENIHPDNLDEYLNKVKARITIEKRTISLPAYKAIYATQAEVDAEIQKVFKPVSASDYVTGFEHDLKLKYADYRLAWDNKQVALKLNEDEEKENASAIQQQKQSDIVAANVQSLAKTPSVSISTAPLKKVYKLAMDETFESANIIITAYLANNQKCLPALRITKWLSGFGVKQMIGALEKIKNEDDGFDFDGLVWTTEDKL